ncbi:GNAT family protein [Pseudarthrobacter phenanthrenivorans]|jgi:RimJ/RimL family protein N-acetyltransferase|uniref:GCN5 family acetyltransferase n=1 Tax=Pseudarthrobacter phenanthrenivorans TaxID=361575 RepID=A0A0B4DDK9_PSEPS|nr:GNAT family protein [Pseudarthrobacter phenanthrenivorans]KIC66762.1 GCN5 family acetyltransferase [Pseudarthrobacter phenanthrenivorans]
MPGISLPIRTERLVLRRFEGGDLDAFHAYHSLPETARFLPGPAKTYTQSMERVGHYANFVFEKEGDWVALAIEAAGEPGLQGEVVLKWLPGRGQGEVGWTLAPAARGKGYGTEAAGAVLRLGFEELGLHRIEARLDELNVASASLCGRLGMRLEARHVDKWHYKGQWATELIYAILADEWRIGSQAASTPGP